MHLHLTVVTFLAFFTTAFTSQLGCPCGCICDYKEYNMSCSNGNITAVPMYMVWCPEILIMENNTIPEIKNGAFTPCGDTIIELSLRNSSIEKIENGVFDEFSKLRTLDLRDNKVKKIGENIFNGLSEINNIYFQNNLIENITYEEQSYDISKLSQATLYLSNNKLKKLDAGIPKRFSVLHLENNEITEITPDGAVYPLISANQIYLTGNNIKSITKRAFIGLLNATWFRNVDSPLTLLNSIVLDNNSIEYIEPFAFEGLSAIKELNISGNNLKILKKHSFRSLIPLQKLFLINSKIETIEIEAFRDLDSLEELNLSDNLIRTLEENVFLDLPRLSTLILVTNRIKSIKKEIFHGLFNLKRLNISYNKLEVLQTASFKGLDNLEILDLSHNEVHTTEVDAFQNLTSLDKLILDHNKLVKLQPLSFREIPNLRELSLRNNHLTSISPKLDEQLNILRTDLYLRGNTVEIPEPKEIMSLEKLVVLDLSNNQLQDLAPGVFRETSKIFSLRLNNNNFHFLRSSSMRGLRRIYELDLHNNPIHCDCAMVNIWLFCTANKIDTRLFEEHDVLCKTPHEFQGREWNVLNKFNTSSSCRPLHPLPARNQAGLFVLGPALLIVVGILTFILHRIARKIIGSH